MGGEHSGVSADTTDILLEIAYFDPERIGATGRKLGQARIVCDARRLVRRIACAHNLACLAAAGLGTFKPFVQEPVTGTFPCPVEIRTDDPEGCPAFYGRVISGVTNGASPEWMQRRLIAAGQRPKASIR